MGINNKGTKMFIDVDVLATLEQIVQENTRYYKEDFDTDKVTLKEAALKQEKDETTFVWLSRKHGTNLFPERSIFLKESCGYNTLQHYSNVYPDNIRCFIVELTSMEQDIIKGNIYEDDVKRLAIYAAEKAMPIDNVVVYYETGAVRLKPTAKFTAEPHSDYGAYRYYREEPADTELLAMQLSEEKTEREMLKEQLWSKPEAVEKPSMLDWVEECMELFHCSRETAEREYIALFQSESYDAEDYE